MTPSQIISHLAALSTLVPLAFCIKKLKSLNYELGLLLVYISVVIITDIICWILVNQRQQTHVVYNLFTVIECSLFVQLFIRQYHQKKTKYAITFFYLFFLVISFFVFVVQKGFNKRDSVINSYSSIFLIALAIGYFYKLMNELDVPNLNEYYFTWINTGVLIYFSSTFILFLFIGFIQHIDIKMYNFFYSFNWIATISFNILLSKGISKIKTK